MLIWDSPEVINDFVSANGGGRCAPGSFSALGWTNLKGKLVGGLTFHDGNGRNLFVNIALANGTFPRGLLSASLHYVFSQLKTRRLTFTIEESNLPSQNLVKRLGASLEATLREAGTSGDMHIYSLFPEDCQIWSRFKNGKK